VSAPDISVIIPNWNGASVLPQCLASLEGALGDARVEVIVYDNGSSDGSVHPIAGERLRRSLLVLEGTRNVGFAEACNRAARFASADLLLLLNSDALLCGCLDDAVSYMSMNRDIGVAQGPILSGDGKHIDSVGSLMTWSGFLAHPLHGRAPVVCGGADLVLPASRDVFAVKGAAMYVRRDVVRQMGLFDVEAFAYMEDSDLSWRAWLAGWRVRYTTSLPLVRHVGGVAANRLPRVAVEFHSFKNRLRSIIVNASSRTLLVMIPVHALMCAAACAAQVLAGQPLLALVIGQAWLWNLRNWRLTSARRLAVQGQRVVSDREVFDRVLVPMQFKEFIRVGRIYQRASRDHTARPNGTVAGSSGVVTEVAVPGRPPAPHPEASVWDELADLDPLWAVLSDPRRKRGRWTWEEFFTTGEEHVSWVLEEARAIGRPVERGRALDFGCGVGRLTAALADRFTEVVGVDISRGMVELAKSSHAHLANMFWIVNSRSGLSGIPDGSFDLVISDRVLQHHQTVDDIVLSLTEMLRVTGEDGLLCFQVPQRLGIAYRTLARWRPYELLKRMGVPPGLLYRRLGLHGMRLTALSEERVVAILEALGAKVLHVDREREGGRTYFVGRNG